jgi:AcrR family transcriptional regulator
VDERQDPEGLPAGLAAAWGIRERPARGPKPALTLARIVEGGVELARSEGLAAVSMARVAQRLGVSTMALYRYVAAKDELLVLMVDAAFGPPPALDADVRGWREALASWAWAQRERVREHVWALQVPITGPPLGPNAVAWLDRALGALAGTGLEEEEKASVVLLVSGYVRSEGTLVAELTAAGGISDAAMASYADTLRALVSPERFPALDALLAAGVFDKADSPDKEFEFGLERILDGVAALIERREG